MWRDISLPFMVMLILGLWLFTRLNPQEEAAHEHPPGAHGGIIVSLGADRYHVEAVFEEGGVLRLYTLGRDASRVIDVEQQTLTAYVKEEGATQASPVSLEPERQPGDAPGRTSLFVGQLPADLEGKSLEVTVPGMRIAGERFRLGFASTSRGYDEHDVGMPDKVEDEQEKELYLVPAGKYTAADIEANGNKTASQKFRGFRARHDFNPQPGDPLCPVTRTKGNPECTWTIGGKTYQFCCPPCVDEFVRLAKEDPDQVKAPESYVKQ